MKMKAYNFRLIPNKSQQTMINKTIGCSRLIYNLMLSEKQEAFKNNLTNFKPKTEKQYKIDFPFLKEVDSISLQQSRIDLTTAYKNHFRKIKRKEKSNLRFKSRKNPKNSYRSVNVNNSIRIEGNRIRLPKIGFVKFKKSREVNQKINSVTVTKNILNEYFVSVLVEEKIKEKKPVKNKIGIDLGIKSFAVCSNDDIIPNPHIIKKYENKLAKEQKILSKRVKDSQNRFKQQKKVFKVHQKIANIRKDFLHKLSTKLINENQVICLEDLSVKEMLQEKYLAKSISDVSWSRFVEYLEYKADWYGREIIKIDKYFPSSKKCSKCSNINNSLTLKDREWKCSVCKTEHDRDKNASTNILVEGLRILKNRRDCGDSLINNCTLV